MIINDKLSQEYYNWLVYDILNCRPDWFPILKLLHMRDYIPILIMDDSRAKDGQALRDLFIMKRMDLPAVVQGANPWVDIPCSMLEMMIALTMRMVDDFYSDFDEIMDMKNIIFYNMMTSLGIHIESATEEQLNQIIDIFIKREYDPSGKGSLFDLTYKTNDIDWREPPIWNQMLAWVTTTHFYDEE